jgi:hypothetical protein
MGEGQEPLHRRCDADSEDGEAVMIPRGGYRPPAWPAACLGFAVTCPIHADFRAALRLAKRRPTTAWSARCTCAASATATTPLRSSCRPEQRNQSTRVRRACAAGHDRGDLLAEEAGMHESLAVKLGLATPPLPSPARFLFLIPTADVLRWKCGRNATVGNFKPLRPPVTRYLTSCGVISVVL